MKFTFEPESKPLDGYTIKRAIHRGGFGEVYYALSDGGKEVALKLIQDNLDVELRGVTQCLNLKHHNLVTIFDIKEDSDGDHWIVMEYVAGKSLDRELAQYPDGAPVEVIGKWLTGIVDGLSFLHDRGIVHRDMKPANVYVEHGQIKIGDVGLSKYISQSRRAAQTQSVGTVYYMAPEIAHGKYGHEVDVYSLGIMLYEMLTGRLPFDGETTGEILMKHLTEKPDLNRVPPRLRPVVGNALQKDASDRTSTANELLAEFRNAVRGVEVAEGLSNDAFAAGGTPFAQTRGNGRSARLVPDVEASAPIFPKDEAARQPANHQRWGNPQGTGNGQVVEPVYTQNSSPRQPGQTAGEPIYSQSHSEERSWFRRAMEGPAGLWLKIAGVVFLIMAVLAPQALAATAGSLFRVGILGAIGYGIYWLIAQIVNAFSMSHDETQYRKPHDWAEDRRNTIAHRHQVYVNAQQRKKLTPLTRRTISGRQKWSEMTGSLTYAAFCSLLFTAGFSLIVPTFFHTDLPSVSQPVFDMGRLGLFYFTTTLASWVLLVISKYSEGSAIEPRSRRFLQFLVGGLVGLGAFGLNQILLVEKFQYWDTRMFESIGSHELMTGGGLPTLAGFVVFFAMLFGMRRWWWHADGFRKKRLSVRTLLLTSTVGLLSSLVFTFPFDWGVMWAAAISSVVQLSASWMPPEDREMLVEANGNV